MEQLKRKEKPKEFTKVLISDDIWRSENGNNIAKANRNLVYNKSVVENQEKLNKTAMTWYVENKIELFLHTTSFLLCKKRRLNKGQKSLLRHQIGLNELQNSIKYKIEKEVKNETKRKKVDFSIISNTSNCSDC